MFQPIIVTFFALLLSTLAIAQTWQDLPRGKYIPSTKTTQKAIWTLDTQPEYQKKIKETYIDFKPTFQGMVKPKNHTPLLFKKHLLSVAEEIPFTDEFPFKDISKLNIKYLDKAHGLFCDYVTDITEDKDGLIFLSSSTGLAIYNGNSFKILKGTSEFELNEIENLFTDSKGLIWIATYHGIAYIKDNYLYVPQNQIKDHVWRIREDAQANIWISTQSKGVYKIRNNSLQHYNHSDYFTESFDTHVDKKGQIWLALPNGIAFLRNDSLFQSKLPNATSSPRTYYEEENELWIGTFYGGLQKIRNDSLFYVEAGTKSRSVYEITSDDRGLWFSSYGNGIRLITKQNILLSFGENEGLTNNGPIYFHVDRFSNIWVSDGQNGLSRIDDNILVYTDENFGTRNISEIEKYRDDIWFFSDGDYLKRLVNGQKYKYTNQGSEQIPPNRHHKEGCVVGKNEAWLANYNTGVVHLKDKLVTYFRTNESDYENTALNLELDSYNRLWYLTKSQELRFIKNDSIVNFRASDFAKYNFFDIVLGKTSKHIYAVSNHAVIIIRGNYYKKIDCKKNIFAVFENANGELWIFMEDGIKIYKDLKEQKTISTDAFKKATIKFIESIDKNKWLAATSNGLMELSVDKNKIYFKEYNQSKGLNLSNISYIKSIDGRVIVVAESDIYYFSSLLSAKNRTTPSLILEKVRVNSKDIPLKNLVFDQDQIIEFQVASISWGNESVFKTRLDKDGKLGEWITSNSNLLSFRELGHGEYCLNLQITNNQGSSEIISIKFVVKPYFYQTRWFIVLIIFLALLMIFGYFRYRISKTKKARIALEKTIEEKTKEISIEKAEVTKRLNEKELLLKEVNHRVKNNFQLVSSLLELQSFHAKSKEAQTILNAGISRIKSLGLAHQKLYNSKNYADIDLQEYVESIINNLNFGTDKNVKLYFDERYVLNIEKAQALGFITNELMTNSMKYAWKKNDIQKKINLSIVKNGNIITYKYSDNGKGFPKKIDTSSLGLILIRSFVHRQLMGEIEMYNESGAITLITFNEEVLN